MTLPNEINSFQNYNTGKTQGFPRAYRNYRGGNNRLTRSRFQNNSNRWFQVRGQYMQRNSPNVRYTMFVPFTHYEKHCHVAMYQFQDLATLFGGNIQQQTNTTTNNAKSTPISQKTKQLKFAVLFAFSNLDSHNTGVTLEWHIGSSGISKTQLGDTVHIHSKHRGKIASFAWSILSFLWTPHIKGRCHSWQNDIYDACNDFNTTIECSVCADVIAKHCFTQEIENDFLCKSQCYREHRKSTNVGHLENGECYERDTKKSMKKPSHKSMVNENRTQKARENMDQNVNENKA